MKLSKRRDLELLYEVGAMRFIQRSWKRFLHPFAQNVTEHSFRVLWLSLIIAQSEQNIDYEKMLKMGLVHDLVESRCGDVDYISRQYTKTDEEQAIRDIFEDTVVGSEMVALWKEYEKRTCLEAKIVKDADNLDVDLELAEQKMMGNDLHDMFYKKRRPVMLKKLYTKAAKDLYKQILQSNPHDWHLKGRNRFNMGDWKK